MNLKYSLILIFAAAVLLLACQAGVKSVDGSGVAGVYTLDKVDGTPIPGVIDHDGVNMRLHAGKFVIKPNGKCTSTTVFMAPNGEEMTRDVSANYTLEGSRLIMKWAGAGITTGMVEGDTFTMDNHGMIFEYKRLASP